jgi:hypothetical protein
VNDPFWATGLPVSGGYRAIAGRPSAHACAALGHGLCGRRGSGVLDPAGVMRPKGRLPAATCTFWATGLPVSDGYNCHRRGRPSRPGWWPPGSSRMTLPCPCGETSVAACARMPQTEVRVSEKARNPGASGMKPSRVAGTSGVPGPVRRAPGIGSEAHLPLPCGLRTVERPSRRLRPTPEPRSHRGSHFRPTGVPASDGYFAIAGRRHVPSRLGYKNNLPTPHPTAAEVRGRYSFIMPLFGGVLPLPCGSHFWPIGVPVRDG